MNTMMSTRSISGKRRRYAWLGAALCAAAWLAVALAVPSTGPAGADTFVRQWMDALRSGGATSFWKPAALMGESATIIAVTLALTALTAWRAGLARALWLPAAVGAAYALNTVLKLAVDRPRPEYAWGIEADGASFPSGNAMLAVVLYGLAAAWLSRYGRIGRGGRAAVVLLAVMLTAAAGFSRLYFGVHYVSDIAAGYLAGGAMLLAVLACSPPKRERH